MKLGFHFQLLLRSVKLRGQISFPLVAKKASCIKHTLHSKAHLTRTRGGISFAIAIPPGLLYSPIRLHGMPLSAAERQTDVQLPYFVFRDILTEDRTRKDRVKYDRSKVRLCSVARRRKTFHRGRSLRNNRKQSWGPKTYACDITSLRHDRRRFIYSGERFHHGWGIRQASVFEANCKRRDDLLQTAATWLDSGDERLNLVVRALASL